MALQTTLATRYWLKTIIMATVCVVLGVWGIWDYVVAIPLAEMESNRAALLRDDIQMAMNTELGSVERDEVVVLLNTVLNNDNEQDQEWIDSITLFRNALDGGNSEVRRQAFLLVEEKMNQYGNVTPPSKFDRPMQWLFILCLPFGCYYLWSYIKMKKRSNAYALDDGGTLSTPEGSWSADDILDIDMERWISKTGKARTTWTAKAIVKDHPPIVLDDYVYKDMHLIIGALAHRFYPDDWTPLAKQMITKESGDSDTSKSSEE